MADQRTPETSILFRRAVDFGHEQRLVVGEPAMATARSLEANRGQGDVLQGRSLMAMRGELVMRDRKLYVLYSSVDDNEPIRNLLYWRVLEIHRGRGFVGEFLGGGDAVTYAGNGTWSAGSKGSVSTGDGSVNAEHVDKVPIPPPPARGKELRWRQGRWERRLASGWASAGEGSATPKKSHHATKSTKAPAQLDREIAATLVPHAAKGDRVLADLKSWGVDREQLAEVREAFHSGDQRRAMALARDLGWNRASKRGRAFR